MYSESLRIAHTCSERWHGAADGFSHGTVTHERAAERIELIELIVARTHTSLARSTATLPTLSARAVEPATCKRPPIY